MNKILIIIDPQNDFCSEGGSLVNKECIETASKIREFLKEHGDEYRNIVYTQDTHFDHVYLETLEGKHLSVKHCILDTWGWEVNPDILEYLKNRDGVWRYDKAQFGNQTWDYDIYDLMYTNVEIDICGFCTDICVITNALLLKTIYTEYEINCLSNLCAGTTPENHEAALKVMKSCQINVI